MAKNKATHNGECQLCGHTQKLPGGALALHGYAVQWNSFQGICPGSRSLSYELSRDLIPAVIVSTDRRIADLKAAQARLRIPTTDENYTIWHTFDRPATRYDKHRPSEDATIAVEEKTSADGSYTWLTFYYIAAKDGFRERLHTSSLTSGKTTVLEVINAHRLQAAERMQFDITQNVNYRNWLQERFDKWSVKPLKAVIDQPKKFKVGIRRNSSRVGGVTVTFPDGSKAYKQTYKLGFEALEEWKKAHPVTE